MIFGEIEKKVLLNKKNKKIFCFVVILVAFLISCVRSKVTSYPIANYEPSNKKEVKLYYLIPPVPFEVLGEVEVKGAPAASWRRVEGRLKKEAAKIGGDAVILLAKENPLVGVYQTPTYIYRGSKYYQIQHGSKIVMYRKYLFGLVIKWKLE